MKQVITKRLSIVITITMMLVLLLNLFLQVESAHDHMAHNASVTIDRIEEIFYTNSENFERLSEALKEEYIIRAKTVSYILEQQPQLEYDVDELNKLAEFLKVDEINLFDKNGTLYSGSHPEYTGLTMFSGAQISFFVPMLLDKDLSLCQDIIPNTASNKLMIYAAVWREDEEGIVQIGLDAYHILDLIEKNEKQYIFSNLNMQEKTSAMILELATGAVIASTNDHLQGEILDELLIPINASNGKYFHAKICGTMFCCVFREYEDQLIGVVWESNALYAELAQSMFLVFYICR